MREYNVKLHALACQKVLEASWPKLITPLDTCGTVILEGERFSALRTHEGTLCQAALDIHFDWFKAVADWPLLKELGPYPANLNFI